VLRGFFGQEAAFGNELPEAKKIKQDEPGELTSADNRKTKYATVAISPLALITSPGTFGFGGISGGYFITPDIIGEVYYNRSASGAGRYETLHTFAYGKFFLTNSMYINAGIGQRKLIHDLYFEEQTGSDYYNGPSAEVTTNGLGLVVAAGNRWQWSVLTLGLDWGMLFVPVVLTSKKTYIYGSNRTDESSLAPYRDKALDTANASAFFLPQFWIGILF